jgi:signal transduction histidine kinase
MKETIDILVLAGPTLDVAAVEHCVREAGQRVVGVVQSVAEARAILTEGRSPRAGFVLLIDAALARAGRGPDSVRELVRTSGVSAVHITGDAAVLGKLAPGAIAGDTITCGLTPRELSLALGLATTRRDLVRADRDLAQLMEALRQNEKRYEALFQDAPVFFWEEDLSTADRALAELRSQGVTNFRAYFETHPERAVEIVAHNRIVHCNATALRYFGAPNLQELQANLSRIYSPNTASHVVGALVAYCEGQRYWQYEAEYYKLTGDPVMLLCRFVFPTPDMSARRMIFCGIDVTERKRSEDEILQLNRVLARRASELQAMNAELESFSFSVSHDLRAPLRAIDGFSQIILDRYEDRLDPRGQSFLVRMREASQRMAHLIENLLQLSRMSRSEMRIQICDMSAMAREILDELHQGTPEREIEIVIEPGVEAKGDPTLLRAVLDNLLGNAWKFTSKKEQARIEFGTTTHEGQPAYFVRDNGAGFDMANAERLFGAFQRLHSSYDFEGTGIGLATVQRIVRRHGGNIWAEAAVDQGATFTFTLSS